MKRVLSKKTGYITLFFLILLDALLDVRRGTEGNPLWQPILNFIGIQYTPIFVPFVLALFYGVVKGGGWLVRKIDKIKESSEELILTALVIVYAVFDLWIVSVDFFGFKLIKSYLYLTPFLVIIGVIYSVWAEKSLKKTKKK